MDGSVDGFARARRRWFVAFFAALAVVVPGGAPAQQPGEPQTLDRPDRAATLLQMAPGRIQVRLKNTGEEWWVAAAPDAVIEVGGEATREMLQPKQFIQCSVELDATGRVTGPVDAVTFPGGGQPSVVAAGLGADPKAKRAVGKRPAGSYTISGLIKSVEGSEVTVQIGRERFVIPLTEDADLRVAATNLAWANPGDDVELEGKFVQRGQLLASAIRVQLVNPLTPPQPRNKARRPSSSP